MPRINQLPAASSVASTDVVAIDTQDKTYRVPKSTLFDGYYTAAEVDAAIAQSTAITDVSSGIVASSTYVDTTASIEKRAYRQGNIVSFHFTFKAAAQSASGQAIFTGLPKAYGNTMQFTAMNTTSQKPVEFAVTTSGALTYWYSNTGFAAGDQIRGSVTYICQ